MKKLGITGISHIIVPIIVFVVLGAVGGTYLLLKSHAETAAVDTGSSTAVTNPISGYNRLICLNSALGYCLVTHGPGSKITIGTSGFARWDEHYGGGTNRHMFTNGAGNCLKATQEGNVTVADGGCNSVNQNEVWVQTSSNPLRLKNFRWGTYLGTRGIGQNWYVYSFNPYPGFYWGWQWLIAAY